MKTPIRRIFAQWPRGVCHRGFHGLLHPENSRGAYLDAVNHGLPFECDVHVTKDGRVVACHDSTLERTTGKAGTIEELDFDYIEKNYRLRDGSTLPSLEEVLRIADRQRPMVLELKVHEGNHVALAAAVKKVIKGYDPAKLVIISFDANVLREFKGTDYNLGLLVGTKADISYRHRHEQPINEFDFIDVEISFLRFFPMFQAYRKAGGIVHSWTIRSKSDALVAAKKADCSTWEIIRTNKPFEGQKENLYLKRKGLGL